MLLRIVVLLATFGLVLVALVAWRRPPRRLERRRFDLGGLGVSGPALVQFTTPYCAPCKAAAPHLARAADRAGVGFAQVDVEARPDVARSHGIRRVPTIAVTSSDGRVVRVWTALPAEEELLAATVRARA